MKSTLSMVSVKNWFEQTRQFRSTCNAHDFLPPNFEFAYTGRNNVYFPSESFVLFFTFFPNSGTRNVPRSEYFQFRVHLKTINQAHFRFIRARKQFLTSIFSMAKIFTSFQSLKYHAQQLRSKSSKFTLLALDGLHQIISDFLKSQI